MCKHAMANARANRVLKIQTELNEPKQVLAKFRRGQQPGKFQEK